MMAIKVNISTSYKLGTSWVQVCVHKKKSLVTRSESPLSLRLVAMIIRCSSVSSSVNATPDIFRSFLFISQMPLMEKSFAFFWVKNCLKTSPSSERNPITVAEIIIKTVQHGKSERGNAEWTRSLIHRSASMKQRGVSDTQANCKRKSSSCMRRLSKYKQKLDN